MKIQILRNGNSIEIRGERGTALEPGLRSSLHNTFQYTKTERIRSGRKWQYVATPVYMMVDTAKDTLITTYGMCPAVVRFLQKEGHTLQCQDLTPPDQNYIHLEPDRSVLDRYAFRTGQLEALEAFIQGRHGVLCAPVGFGKTFLLSVLIQMYPTAKFHICTRSRDVLNEIYRRLVSVTPDVGMFCGERKDRDCRVTVITADSLGRLDTQDVAFLIFDECHQAAAPTYMDVLLNKYTVSRMYGFTATPRGRSDGADTALNWIFGDVIYNMNYEAGVQGGLVVPITVEWLHCFDADGTSGMWSETVSRNRHLIWRNGYRNALISSYVNEKCAEDEKVLILVSTIEHALYLKQYLPEFTLVHGNLKPDDLYRYQRQGLLPEDYVPLKAKDRNRMKEEFKNGTLRRVIATDVWSTGVDFPDLSVVINASARASSISAMQGGGRASRVADGKSSARVVDIVDRFDGTNSPFYRNACGRKQTYEEAGWTQSGWKRL